MEERLQKILSARGIVSRRGAELLITEGRVQVNGAVARLGDRADPERDEILVDGQALPKAPEKIYIALNKPKGYVTTLHDEKGRRNVTELVSGIPARLYPVGRLDMNTEGLLILTNDGDFANQVMHPSMEKEKVYHVCVSGDATAALELLRAPMEIDGYRISPAKVKLLDRDGSKSTLEITIHEGRNRQIRKMCDKAGLRVHGLRRVAVGDVGLGDLKTGAWRHLTQLEIQALFCTK